MGNLEKVREEIAKAKKVVFFGGAGVSTASGIPDFRSESGLFAVRSKYGVDYETLLSHDYFEDYPERFYEFYWDSMVHEEARPNRAHKALAAYEAAGHEITIVTQNIDMLHQKAGNKRVVELHGSIGSYYCTKCAKNYSLDDIPHHGVPTCSCGGILKPRVVLYQEALPERAIGEAIWAIHECDVLIVGGTSLVVYPAADLIRYFQGSHKVLINLGSTPLDYYFDSVIHEDIGKTLEEILK